jgi:hypothetical protein
MVSKNKRLYPVECNSYVRAYNEVDEKTVFAILKVLI